MNQITAIPKDQGLQCPRRPALFSVWFDMNFGGEFGPPEWHRNSVPKPLADALAEADEARNKWRHGGSPWIVKVEPEA